MVRRRHCKLTHAPESLRQEVDRWLDEGRAYVAITEDLVAKGFEVGKSSVARYAKSRTLHRARIQALAVIHREGEPETGLARRRHGKIDDFDEATRRQVDRWIVEGVTYVEITKRLEMRGLSTSNSAVARRGTAVQANRDYVLSLIAETNLV